MPLSAVASASGSSRSFWAERRSPPRPWWSAARAKLPPSGWAGHGAAKVWATAPRGRVFAAIDDASRLGFARIYPDETADSALAFLVVLDRFYASHAIVGERVLTDNGTCFKRRWQLACEQREIAVRKTRPYRPQTNGKVERFIRTLLEISAYAYPYTNEHDAPPP